MDRIEILMGDITRGFNLPASYVIHTVGPRFRDGKSGEAELLANCYRSSLRLAVKHGITTIAFPSISTGIYGYPIREASAIALREIGSFLSGNQSLNRVVIVCFSKEDYSIYVKELNDLQM